MNALSNAMDAVPPVSPLWYWRVGLAFFIRWIWPNLIMIQLCFPSNIADAMVHITYSAFSLHHYHNDYHEHHQLHLFVMLACYNWFLFKLFETPRDWDQGWNISNEPKKSCVVGQENNMPPIDYSIWGFFVTYPFLKNLSISGYSHISSHILELVLIFLCSHCFHFSGGTLPVRVLTGRMMPAIWCKPVRADLICNHCSSCNHTDTAM